MKDLIQNAKAQIEKFNASFEYVAGPLEIANEIWSSRLNWSQRLEIMKASDCPDSMSLAKKQTRALQTLVKLYF